MAQEVRNIDQRTPPTTQHRDRIPSRPVFVPPSDIYETKDSIVVLAEMPGVAPDGVDITLERRVLTIRGRSAASEHAWYQRVYNEFQRGLRARLHAFRKHRPRPDRGETEGRLCATGSVEAATSSLLNMAIRYVAMQCMSSGKDAAARGLAASRRPLHQRG